MRRVVTILLAGSVGLLGAPGCQHDADAPPVVAPPAVSAPAQEAAPAPVDMPPAAPASSATVDAGPSPEAAAAEAPTAPSMPDMTAAPAYPASSLYETFSAPAARNKIIGCYLPGKQRDPKLRGKVIVKFTINANGGVKPAANEGSNLPDDAVISCVVRTIKTLKFPRPLEGSVTVVYPLIFHSSGDEVLILPDAGKK